MGGSGLTEERETIMVGRLASAINLTSGVRCIPCLTINDTKVASPS